MGAIAVPTATRTTRWPAWLPRPGDYPRLTFGGLVLLLLVAGAVFAPLLSGPSPTEQHLSDIFHAPSAQYPLGTDQLGRDVLSRALHGGRLALGVAIAAVALSMVVGVAMGLAAGYLGRWADGALMRLLDGIMVFPELVLALAITYALGPSFWNVVCAIAVVNVPRFARVVRGQVLTLRERDFIASSVVSGASSMRTMVRHLLPNVTEVIIVQAALTGGMAIFTAASLSFLGLGLPPPAPDWGGMLKDGYLYLEVIPMQALVPGCFIFAAMLSFNLLGDGLRDLFDPRTQPRRRRRADRAGGRS